MPTGMYKRQRRAPLAADTPHYERDRKAAYRARVKADAKAELIAEAQAHARADAYEDGLA